MKATDVFSFCDYRSFLKAYAEDCRQTNPRWTYGAWAKRLRLGGTATLTMILNGQREAGPQLVDKFCNYFKFDARQATYFRNLVYLHKVNDNPELALKTIERIKIKHPKIRFLDDREFSYISHWHYYAIRELIQRRDFKEDPIWISAQFDKKIATTAILTAIDTLIELKLIKRDPDGKLVQADGQINTQTKFASEAICRYHEQSLDLAKATLRKTPREQRNYRASILNIRRGDLPKVEALFNKFQDELDQLLESRDGDSTYHFSMQFFPLTVCNKELT